MRIPVPIIKGVIDRRILVNFRVEPDALARLLPSPFRPKLFNGCGMAGICLIRLKGVRPRGLPSFVGMASENAAHRIAVEWVSGGQLREGVFIPRRDTNSRFNTWAGGRVFPGWHHHADFQVKEAGDRFEISIQSADGALDVFVSAHLAQRLAPSSVFGSLEEASAFFAAGSLGYSVTNHRDSFDGLELRSLRWKVEPLEVDKVKSSFFNNRDWFPPDSIQFDCALLMRNIPHEWIAKGPFCCRGEDLCETQRTA